MTSSGYGTELTVEGAWAATWDTTQFNYINIIIGTQFNFWITDDAATDITNAAVIDILKAETHILFGYWNALVKSSAVEKPWDFIMIWLRENLSGNQFYYQYSELIKRCKEIISGSIKIVSGRWEPDIHKHR